MTKVCDLISLIEKLAPADLACEWDNVGLQVGSGDRRVGRVLLTLDVTEGVVEEAAQKGCQLIIAHHPLIHNPLKRVTGEEAAGRIILEAARNGICIYSAHTNLDQARGGLSDYLARLLGINNPAPFGGDMERSYYKLVVFIPEDHYQRVREAVFNAGAGYIGNYSHTSFSVSGQGSFKPLAGSSPYLGKVGELARVGEVRLETLVTRDRLAGVIQAMLAAHPYEEVAYDIYQLANQGETISPGRIGELEKEITLGEYVREVASKLQLPAPRYCGPPDRVIQRVAAASGSAAGLIEEAGKAGAELYITGDIKYHQAQRAEEIGLALIDAGHYHTEVIVKELLRGYLQDRAADVELVISELKTDPWNHL